MDCFDHQVWASYQKQTSAIVRICWIHCENASWARRQRIFFVIAAEKNSLKRLPKSLFRLNTSWQLTPQRLSREHTTLSTIVGSAGYKISSLKTQSVRWLECFLDSSLKARPVQRKDVGHFYDKTSLIDTSELSKSMLLITHMSIAG